MVMYPARPIAMEQLEATYTLHRYDQADDQMDFLAEHGARCTALPPMATSR